MLQNMRYAATSGMTIREFWDVTFMVPRLALVCAAIAGALNLASYAGLGMSGVGRAFALVHIVVMVLGFVLFVQLIQHHVLAVRAAGVQPDTTALPTRLIWGTVAAGVYLLILLLALFAIYGEGYPELRGGREMWIAPDSPARPLAPGSIAAFEARGLRVFSAAWLFFALLIALTGHRVQEKIRGYQAARRQAAA
jgi:hypothetical protein